MKWYAISVFDGKEENVQKRLDARFREFFLTLVPKKHIIFRRGGVNNIRVQNLFPGYVLIQTEMDKHKCEIINKISGVIRLVSADKDFVIINDDEMALIQKLINKDSIIEISKILKDGPGNNITVLEGPLKGMESIIQRVDAHARKAYVLLNPMGESRPINVGAEIIYK